MYCKECGTLLPEGVTQCPRCGTSVRDTIAAATPPAGVRPSIPEQPQPRQTAQPAYGQNMYQQYGMYPPQGYRQPYPQAAAQLETNPEPVKVTNVFGIAGCVLAVFYLVYIAIALYISFEYIGIYIAIAVIPLVFSSIGTGMRKQCYRRGNKAAVAGLIISIIGIIADVVIVLQF